ncbi:hypothetical protein B9Z55_006014 [Caenorhabditis nigoni]|uniref:Uncharacterized protein n=1 Tax=Caenorhabditis nigoni TaxID=1611254 RepID=A0A2G5V3A8_9PELO|nr:hypothetical protein B9Z55_006014 [Caenorhabditis nigoni]
MCQLDELKDYGNNTVLLMILSLFTALMILSIYMNIRLLVILCHRFKKEQKYNYFPMLMLLNCLSMINELILFAGIFLPFVEIEKYHNIKYPFIYSLVTPSEIALADVLLCAQRIWLHKSDKKDTVASRWYLKRTYSFLCQVSGFHWLFSSFCAYQLVSFHFILNYILSPMNKSGPVSYSPVS